MPMRCSGFLLLRFFDLIVMHKQLVCSTFFWHQMCALGMDDIRHVGHKAFRSKVAIAILSFIVITYRSELLLFFWQWECKVVSHSVTNQQSKCSSTEWSRHQSPPWSKLVTPAPVQPLHNGLRDTITPSCRNPGLPVENVVIQLFLNL